MKAKSLIVCVAVWLCACQSSIEEWHQPVTRCAGAPVALTSSACFVYNGQGYVFGGRTANGTLSNHLYSYNPSTDTWTDLGATPLKARVRARAICVGDEVYIGLGFNGHVLEDSAYLADWWRWQPATNTWDTVASYPSERTVGPVIGTDGTYIYAADGGKQNFERWIFRYSIADDEWTQLADGLPRMASYPPRAHSACGAFCQGRFFLGAGYTRDGSSDFWIEPELRADSIVWHGRTGLNGKRHNATAAADKDYIYVSGGHLYGGTVTNGKLYDDILRYNVAADQWVRIAHLPDGERENMVSWVIGSSLFVGLGNDSRNRPCAQLYRMDL